MDQPILPAGARQHLIDAHRRYSSDGNEYYDEALLEIQDRAESRGCLGKVDIGSLLLWKRLNLSTSWTTGLNRLPDKEVREITSRAFLLARDPQKGIPEAASEARAALRKLPGCATGAAVASTILVAGAPHRMAVYDRRGLSSIRTLNLHSPTNNYGTYMEHVCLLVDVVNSNGKSGWVPRDVDKALYELKGTLPQSAPE